MKIVHRQLSPSGSTFASGLFDAAVGTTVPARTIPDVGRLGTMKLIAADIAADGSYADLTWEAETETARRLLDDATGDWSAPYGDDPEVDRYEIGAGTPIDCAVGGMVAQARRLGRTLRAEFNGIEIRVSPTDTETEVEDRWHADVAARRFTTETHKVLQIEVASRIALAKILNELGARSVTVPPGDLAKEVVAALGALGLVIRPA